MVLWFHESTSKRRKIQVTFRPQEEAAAAQGVSIIQPSNIY